MGAGRPTAVARDPSLNNPGPSRLGTGRTVPLTQRARVPTTV